MVGYFGVRWPIVLGCSASRQTLIPRIFHWLGFPALLSGETHESLRSKQHVRSAGSPMGQGSKGSSIAQGSYILVLRPKTAGIPETMVCRILLYDVVFLGPYMSHGQNSLYAT